MGIFTDFKFFILGLLLSANGLFFGHPTVAIRAPAVSSTTTPASISGAKIATSSVASSTSPTTPKQSLTQTHTSVTTVPETTTNVSLREEESSLASALTNAISTYQKEIDTIDANSSDAQQQFESATNLGDQYTNFSNIESAFVDGNNAIVNILQQKLDLYQTTLASLNGWTSFNSSWTGPDWSEDESSTLSEAESSEAQLVSEWNTGIQDIAANVQSENNEENTASSQTPSYENCAAEYQEIETQLENQVSEANGFSTNSQIAAMATRQMEQDHPECGY